MVWTVSGKLARKRSRKPAAVGGPAIGQDLEIDKAGSAVDGDIGVTAAAVERRQVFDIDVDEPGRGVGLEGGGRGFFAA